MANVLDSSFKMTLFALALFTNVSHFTAYIRSWRLVDEATILCYFNVSLLYHYSVKSNSAKHLGFSYSILYLGNPKESVNLFILNNHC